MFRSRYLSVLAVLICLALTAYTPIVTSGLVSRQMGIAAIRTGDYAQAAASFGSAAPKLSWQPQLWEMSGLAAYQAGDYPRAASMLQEARERGVLSGTGWEALGSSMWASGLPGLAMEAWLAGTKTKPDAPELWDRLAGAYHAQRDYAAERYALERRIQVEDDAAAQYRLALLLIGWDDEGALEALDASARLDPQVVPAQSTLKAAIDAARVQGGDSERLVVIGRSLGLVEEWALATRAFEQAVGLDDTNAEARAWLGEARQHIDEDGRLDLDAALSLDPNSSVVHTLRGLYWRRNGNLGVSLAEYSRAVQLDPQNAGLQSLLGEAYAASGDLVSALSAYENAVELAPAESAYWRMLALFSAESEVQVLDVGVAAGLKAVELAPKDPEALDALGWAYAQAGYLVKAEGALLRALEIAPQYAPARLHLGVTYLRWGQNDMARQQLEEAARLDAAGAAGTAASRLLELYFSK